MQTMRALPHAILREERQLRSVANLTRRDGEEVLALAPRVPVRTEVETLPLGRADEALRRLRAGEVTGALVLVPQAAPARVAGPARPVHPSPVQDPAGRFRPPRRAALRSSGRPSSGRERTRP
jgi:hypothetical protein